MAELGIAGEAEAKRDIAQESKTLDRYLDQQFDEAITMCDHPVDELGLLPSRFSFAANATTQVVLNAFEASFLPADEKVALIAEVRNELTSGTDHW
jgi:hypothetical protein